MFNLFQDDDKTVYSGYENQGFESFGENELVKQPVLGISQPTGEYDPDGVFYLNNTKENLGKKVRVVILHIQKSMAYQPGGHKTPTICWSPDMMRPSQDSAEIQNPQCHRRTSGAPVPVCKFAMWTNGTERIQPACQQVWKVGCLLVNENNQKIPDGECVLFVRGANLKPFRDFASVFRTNYRRYPSFAIAVELQLKHRTPEDGSKGSFYQIDMPDLRDSSCQSRVWKMPVEALPELLELSQFFREELSGSPIASEEPQGQLPQHNQTYTQPHQQGQLPQHNQPHQQGQWTNQPVQQPTQHQPTQHQPTHQPTQHQRSEGHYQNQQSVVSSGWGA